MQDGAASDQRRGSARVLARLLERSPAGEPSPSEAALFSPLETCIRELADREAIRDLVVLYAHRTAHGGPLADLFTHDGVYISHFPGQDTREAHGRDAIEAFFAEYFKGLQGVASPQPMIHNLLMEIEGDNAIGVCSNEVRLTFDGKSTFGSGYYEDRFRREDGRWKFAERYMVFTQFSVTE